jgi:hypothetical protein
MTGKTAPYVTVPQASQISAMPKNKESVFGVQAEESIQDVGMLIR